MKPKFKTMRDATSRPTNSAIPRTEGANFLMLNRLATERERLLADEADLLARLEQKRKRMAQIETEIEHYKSQIELFNTPAAPPAVRTRPASRPNSSLAQGNSEPEEPTNWQSVMIEY
jgi:hypothetical protein